MGYREVAPRADLAAYVQCVWQRSADDGDVLVLPDGCVDLWSNSGSLFVAGPDREARVHRSNGSLVGIRLRPGVAGAVLGVDAAALTGLEVDVADLWGCSTGERLAEDPADGLAHLVRDRLADAEVDHAVVAASALLGAGMPVSAVAEQLGVGERSLRRRFLAHVGYPAKVLDRVLRFQRFLALADPARRAPSLAVVAAEAGFADQAHLARESRDLAGLTPSDLVERWWGDVRSVQAS
jgi:AraC-like DNA-binding protein